MERNEIVALLLENGRPHIEQMIDTFMDAGGDIDTLSDVVSPTYTPAEAGSDGKNVPYPVMTPDRTKESLEGTGLNLADAILAYPDLAQRLAAGNPIWGILKDAFQARGRLAEGEINADAVRAEEAVEDFSADSHPETTVDETIVKEGDNELLSAVQTESAPTGPETAEDVHSGENADGDRDDSGPDASEHEQRDASSEAAPDNDAATTEGSPEPVESGNGSEGRALDGLETKDEAKTEPTNIGDAVSHEVAELLARLRELTPHGLKAESSNPGPAGNIVGWFRAPDGVLHAALHKEDEDARSARFRIQENHKDWTWIGEEKPKEEKDG